MYNKASINVRGFTSRWTRFYRSVTTFSSKFNNLPQSKKFLQINKPSKGLFLIPQLTDYSGLYILKENVISEADSLLREALSHKRTRKLVQVFDDLSDALCRVADMADFVRVAHPKAKYREAAEEACIAVSTIVQQMNTNRDLYDSIRAVVNSGDAMCGQPYTDTDVRVAQLFLDDFEKCGIHLSEEKRLRFVQLSEAIMLLETNFSQGTHNPSVVTKELLPTHLHHIFGNQTQLVVSSMITDHPNSDVREAAFRSYLLPNERQEKTLEALLRTRDTQAKLAGFTNYAERALRGSMTETPDNVNRFLTSLSDKVTPLCEQDFRMLQAVKLQISGERSPLQPWDVSYYSGIAKRSSMDAGMSGISSYFSLGACMNGLNLIVESLFGVRLEVVTPEPLECWHSSVYKLEVRQVNSNHVIGLIYCDFFERHEKPPQDCHFTIQCARLRDDGTYQTPKVVLMMNFPPPSSSRPTLLSPQQLENLFHEFGHAMHSMLGRTRYQHVSGTRCSTDFAEVPSILMEYFASDYRVLKEFAVHYETGDPIPENLAHQMIRSKSMFSAAETQLQIFYSALDQRLHGCHPLDGSIMQVLANTQSQFYPLAYVPNTAWHLRFGHLVGYGAKYFAYLMSKAIAAKIWHHCFMDNPLSRKNGLLYMEEILQHGGGKPPYSMVQSLTGTRPTVESLVQSLVEETIQTGHYSL